MINPVLEKIYTYKKFIFEGYEYGFDEKTKVLTILLKYSLDKQEIFEEKITFPISKEQWDKVNIKALIPALEAFFLMGGISYYKTFCPANIEQEIVPMNEEQAQFWNKIYEKGLGEFFYRNEIDFRGLVNFRANKLETRNVLGYGLSERALLPIGGGKDSIVSAEIVRASGLDFVTFSLRDAEPIKATAEVIGKSRIVIGRQIAPRLVTLNEEGALNGHVPITAFISFLLAVSAVLYDFKYLVLSLEKSSNFGQLDFHGMEINHQYSKSEEFEGDFRQYVQKYVNPEIEYFSLLRNLFELKIIELFAKLPNLTNYLPIFTSCNANFKIVKEKCKTRWCGECPKCAFIYLCLAPFFPKVKLVEIFGKDMLNDKNLLELFEELVGMVNFKPFECVGTIEECQAALWKISTDSDYSGDYIVKVISEKHLSKWAKREENWGKILKIQDGGFVPELFMKIIEKMSHEN